MPDSVEKELTNGKVEELLMTPRSREGGVRTLTYLDFKRTIICRGEIKIQRLTECPFESFWYYISYYS